jgi:Bacterial Ig domain
VRGLDLNADATRLIVAGRFGTMSGSGRTIAAPTAVIDISNPAAPVLTAHSSSGYVTIADLQDAGIAPDGSTVGLVYGTATTSDYVYLTPTTESAVTYRWRHYMRDSSFSVAVTNTAVYVGGHFCKPDAGPGASELMEPKMGLDSCTGTTNFTGGVWRTHLAALALADGTPLTWNPGQDSFGGAQRITATTRGLLVGFDGDRTNSIRTGALAFFDFGAAVEDVTPPSDVTFTSPTAGATVNNPVTIAGTATDNVAVSRYSVTVQRADGQYVQADGTLGAAVATFTVYAPEPATPLGTRRRRTSHSPSPRPASRPWPPR